MTKRITFSKARIASDALSDLLADTDQDPLLSGEERALLKTAEELLHELRYRAFALDRDRAELRAQHEHVVASASSTAGSARETSLRFLAALDTLEERGL